MRCSVASSDFAASQHILRQTPRRQDHSPSKGSTESRQSGLRLNIPQSSLLFCFQIVLPNWDAPYTLFSFHKLPRMEYGMAGNQIEMGEVRIGFEVVGCLAPMLALLGRRGSDASEPLKAKLPLIINAFVDYFKVRQKSTTSTALPCPLSVKNLRTFG